MSTTELGAEKKRPDIQWLDPSDYYKKMSIVSKVFYRLGIIRYFNQRYGSLYYEGFFKYNLYNPLTWITLMLIYVLTVICSVFIFMFSGITQMIDSLGRGMCVSIPVKRGEV